MKTPSLIAATLLMAGFMTQNVYANSSDTLTKVIEQRSDQSRDIARHPQATIEFFQLKPGMVVAEVLPGGLWYSKILAPYIASSGKGGLYALDYPAIIYQNFGASEENVKKRIDNNNKFAAKVHELTSKDFKAANYPFDDVPDSLDETVDRVLFIRALHNLNRYESKDDTVSTALQDTYRILKPNGLVGVVQHRLPESAPDDKADGSRGYLKQSQVIALFESMGFKLVAQSEINANPKDKPNDDDIVWRLPPSLATSKDDPALAKKMKAIGESDRMTLLFKKVTL
ncbi:class I SAM-dependent methyltransferase [Shewanella marina]|uniref:class I SAM-dependent methyltransferase n=1 Tax=Shewanella marina TaxID=487319 RepID=UPI00046E8EB9|nr:class I SAM-dependent methyltransferase [Shewanella marina]